MENGTIKLIIILWCIFCMLLFAIVEGIKWYKNPERKKRPKTTEFWQSFSNIIMFGFAFFFTLNPDWGLLLLFMAINLGISYCLYRFIFKRTFKRNNIKDLFINILTTLFFVLCISFSTMLIFALIAGGLMIICQVLHYYFGKVEH